ncbi:MAG: tRNA (adenosine(37)-N6)-threonylcarbamoyltransferase complex transferase subunit TsaD [Cyanobacteria bacterium SIG30]|nr:tRNA (adenosine(37)-N6)-threonylcarbamoyltransferase complex transferase subunit TsaD [Cyanobacteria bacterium SIG30]
MLICGIESSCDETACAIVEDGRYVISNTVASQIKTHMQFGGVVPEIAAREHLESINFVIDETFKKAGKSPSEMDAFAATMGPGLVGSLLVGANAAKAMSLVYNKPFVAVDHLQAHVCANFIDSTIEPPFLCLLVSGGHTQLIKIAGFENQEIVAETIDDAVGEVYDKVARLLGLPYPGGILLDKTAHSGNPHAFDLPIAKVGKNEFSFSGLKSATARLIETFDKKNIPTEDICASFQHTVAETLVQKTLMFAKEFEYDKIVLAGGVAANSEIRRRFSDLEKVENGNYIVNFPDIKYCTDNAAMVASCAYFNPIKTHDSITMEVYSRG